MSDWLSELEIFAKNSGANDGSIWWSTYEKEGAINSYNPANEKIIGQIYRCSVEDYQHIVNSSREAFIRWREVPAPKRGELIYQIARQLRAKKSILGRLIAMESGKSKAEADGEVQEMIDMADFAVGQSRMLYGKTMHSERFRHRMYEQWHPLGVVGVLTAFNFPVAVWAWNAFIAAISGNTLIWKPSPKTSLCAIAVQKICNKVMLANAQPGIFSLFITDEVSHVNSLIEDKRVAMISFTGSTAVGRQINEKVAKRLGRCLLELSGNNAIIIDEQANLELAIPVTLFGAIGTAGQRCTTTRRLIIHEAQYNKVTELLKKAYQKIRIGDPLDERNLMGPLIDKTAVQNYCVALRNVVKSGGEILWGGKILEVPGCFVEPALVRAENEWEIVQQETFAPILYLMTFRTIEEAVQLNNNVHQGLSSAIFTENLYNAEYFLSACGSDCGIANVNIATSGAEIGGAFGGEKDTGGGREAGSNAWQAYMRRQTVTINWSSEVTLAQDIIFDL